MTNTVILQQVTVKTANKTLLKIDNFQVNSGKRYVIIGPSGAGKSTLLKSIATLQSYSSGEIFLFNEKMEKKNKRLLRKRMVYVAQQEVMFFGSVEDNVGLGLKFRKDSKDDRQLKISNILKLLGLEGYEKRNVESLSGGEIQRVALARSLVLEPELLLLDEPTANLDPFNVQLIERAIIKYCEEKGATLILATHNMNQARRIGQHGIFIEKGKMTESGDITDLLENPKTKELIDFLEWV
ncbi:ABC transporter ATP-binding protein [Neobacillus sp. PS3-40]|uniref:ABC transporter ATP-binding protein n=1 Tax=Neobacillus sp. PS3-40 TaxID=3070679 RepID=UPI0027E00D59|nr:ABC transporter ATP-binding protein [Neobacillus sp. PS3-40]WML46189.1 ABC transporter ATP-binding protein [Neobacillus sp. PS3-40]